MYKYEKVELDHTTGEILSESKTIIKNVKAKEFIQVYLDDMSGLLNIKTKAEKDVLIWFWKFSKFPDETFSQNYVSLDAILFEKITQETGLKEQSIRNTIVSLVKKDLLIKDKNRRGIYYLNKKYFWKGKVSELTRNIDLNVNYNINRDETINNFENGNKGN
jgi:hypothetical protein